jgi:hypothetical protein
MHSLTDDRNYNAQVNCVLDLSDGNILVAGEDGLIKIISRGGEFYLEKMLDNTGYLANIEDVKELENGDIICVETLGSIGIYKKINNKNKYKNSDYELKIIPSKIISDCFYHINILNSNEVEIWGETFKRHIINIK